MGGELSGPTTGAAAAAPSAVPATMAVIMTRKILTSIIALLGFSAVAYAQSSLPKRQVFHGVVTNWEKTSASMLRATSEPARPCASGSAAPFAVSALALAPFIASPWPSRTSKFRSDAGSSFL